MHLTRGARVIEFVWSRILLIFDELLPTIMVRYPPSMLPGLPCEEPGNLFRIHLLITTGLIKHRQRVVRERLKFAVEVTSRENHRLLLGLLSITLQTPLIPFPRDAFDLRTPAPFQNNVKYETLLVA